MSLLNTLLGLLDEINDLKKQIYTLEHQGRQDENNNKLFLENAIENAEFEIKVLRSNLEYYENTEG